MIKADFFFFSLTNVVSDKNTAQSSQQEIMQRGCLVHGLRNRIRKVTSCCDAWQSQSVLSIMDKGSDDFFFPHWLIGSFQGMERPATGQRDAVLLPTIAVDVTRQLCSSFVCKQSMTLLEHQRGPKNHRGMPCISFQINDPNIDVKMNSFLHTVVILWHNNCVYFAFGFYLCFQPSYLLDFLSHCIIFLGFKCMSDKGREMSEAYFASEFLQEELVFRGWYQGLRCCRQRGIAGRGQEGQLLVLHLAGEESHFITK